MYTNLYLIQANRVNESHFKPDGWWKKSFKKVGMNVHTRVVKIMLEKG
jgi:hypothetical protein